MALIKLLLADDHAIVTDGLRSLFQDRFCLVGVVTDGRALVEASKTLNPDVIITDISMPLLNGIDAIRQIKMSQPLTKAIVLTMHCEPELAVEAFRAGASGYLLKVSPGEELITAIGEVYQGRHYLSSLIAKDLISVLIEAAGPSGGGDAKLTSRQREILQLIAEGRTMKEISALLRISQRTAEWHKYEMMQALCVENTAALVQYAVRLRLVAG
jgi:DNA-binding NarL/FixJ family response regulator